MAYYKCACVVILFGVYTHTALSEYYVATAQTDWDVKNPPCMLATPTISYNKNGYFIEENIPIHTDESLTVGYVSIPAAFENKGCIKHGDSIVKQYDVPSDPGTCFSACNTTLFGISEHDCYCFNESLKGINDTMTECNESCSTPGDTVCGGKIGRDNDTHTFISVYKRVEGSPTEDENNCLSYTTGSESSWTSCTQNLFGLCELDGAIIEFITDDSLVALSKNWKDYTTICYSKHRYPASEALVRSWSMPLTRAKFWIGQMKSWIIVQFNSSFETYFHYGLIQRKDNTTIQLTFNETRPSGRFLCWNETEEEIEEETVTDENTHENGGFWKSWKGYVVYGAFGIVAIALVVFVTAGIWKIRQCKAANKRLNTSVLNKTYDADVISTLPDQDNQRHDGQVQESSGAYEMVNIESIANSGETKYTTPQNK